MTESHDAKFSNVDVSDTGVYQALYKLVMKLANDNVNDENIMMSFDEIVGELLEELAKGLRHYRDLPFNNKLAVIRRMLDNRISELRYKYYVTHRKQHATDISIESQLDVDDENSSMDESVSIASDQPTPEAWLLSIERVRDTRSLLSDTAKTVFDCVVYGENARLANVLVIHLQRSATANTVPLMKIKPWMVADALFMSEKEVNVAFHEIATAYKKVVSSD